MKYPHVKAILKGDNLGSPKGPNRLEKAPVTSAASAFMGATYTILKFCFWMTPWLMLASTSRSTANMAMLVFPAPVGAQTSKFSLLQKAAGKMRLWMRFRVLQAEQQISGLCPAEGCRQERGLLVAQPASCIITHSVCGLWPDAALCRLQTLQVLDTQSKVPLLGCMERPDMTAAYL